MTDLSEFLLARIAEDEGAAGNPFVVIAHPTGIWSPDRVLAECEAKRRIVGGWTDMAALGGDRLEQVETLRWVCELLALAYADHPDHRPEWSPLETDAC